MSRSKKLKIAAFISGFLALFTFFSPHLLKLWLTWQFRQELADTPGVQEAASIGIIGGADGPTAIYLTSSQPNLQIGLAAGLGALAVLLFLASNKKSPTI